jgi:ATP-binding cassette subfamily F protein 3
MIRIQNLAMSFAGRELYRDVNLFVAADSRIGLVGPNGSGKSTLFRLIKRELEPDSGGVEVNRDLRIAHLPQTGVALRQRTVLAETLSAFSEVERLDAELDRIERELEGRNRADPTLRDLLERYAHLRSERDHAGYAHESQARTLLAALGFPDEDLTRPTDYSSGGFQVRVALAKLLLQEPDLLLLDEPTNFLDIEAIAWLQDYLKSFQGAYLLVTHDRYLLDACCDRTWAIEKPTIVAYKGNYSEYSQAKVLRDARLEKLAELQQKEIEKARKFIEKFRARKDAARRVKSKEKALERMELVVVPGKRKRIHFRFPEAALIYGQAIALKGVTRSFEGKQVLADVHLTVAGGERIGLFGANGEGKTTLLRIISRELAPSEGSVWHSEKLQVAFYRQGAEELLDPDLTVIDEVQQDAEGYTLLELRTVLGAFLFSGDDIYKSVRVLSGGERTRLALIKVLLRPSNLLLLDEPTNHLDIESREVLEEAIGDYQNTVIFAAHDRFMIDRLARKTVAVHDGHAILFPGNYTYATTAGRGSPRTPEPEAATLPPPAAVIMPVRPVSVPRSAPAPKPADEEAARRSRLVKEKDDRVRQLDLEFAEAKRRLDFTRAREVWTERQALIDEIIVLRNQG